MKLSELQHAISNQGGKVSISHHILGTINGVVKAEKSTIGVVLTIHNPHKWQAQFDLTCWELAAPATK